MKKALSLGIITLAILFLPGQKTEATQQETLQAPEKLLYYTWYYDMDATSPVGTENTVNGEMQRLRALHPGYIFTAQPQWPCIEYEYGYLGYFYAFIYSDLPFALNANNGDSAARQHNLIRNLPAGQP